MQSKKELEKENFGTTFAFSWEMQFKEHRFPYTQFYGLKEKNLMKLDNPDSI